MAALAGTWNCNAGETGVWLIEDDGRAFYNGKRLGSGYDIREGALASAFRRNDGWTAVQEDGENSHTLARTLGWLPCPF